MKPEQKNRPEPAFAERTAQAPTDVRENLVPMEATSNIVRTLDATPRVVQPGFEPKMSIVVGERTNPNYTAEVVEYERRQRKDAVTTNVSILSTIGAYLTVDLISKGTILGFGVLNATTVAAILATAPWLPAVLTFVGFVLSIAAIVTVAAQWFRPVPRKKHLELQLGDK